jgi:hypothetical protein
VRRDYHSPAYCLAVYRSPFERPPRCLLAAGATHVRDMSVGKRVWRPFVLLHRVRWGESAEVRQWSGDEDGDGKEMEMLLGREGEEGGVYLFPHPHALSLATPSIRLLFHFVSTLHPPQKHVPLHLPHTTSTPKTPPRSPRHRARSGRTPPPLPTSLVPLFSLDIKRTTNTPLHRPPHPPRQHGNLPRRPRCPSLQRPPHAVCCRRR